MVTAGIRSVFLYLDGKKCKQNSLKRYWQPGLEGIRQYQYNYGENHNNPFLFKTRIQKARTRTAFMENIALEYAFTDHLKLKARVADDFYNDFRPMQWAVSTVETESGRYEIVQIKNEERNADFLLPIITRRKTETSESMFLRVETGLTITS